MESEVTAAWISAFGALGGVAFGTITAIVAARIQARPAHRAAEAAHAQAEAAYRAALDSAREQIKGAAAQSTGSARRQAYAAFINEAHKLQLAVEKFDKDFYGPTVDTREAREALDRVDKAAALVLLEGPEEVTEAAWEVYNEGSAGVRDYEQSGDVRASWAAVIQAGLEEELHMALTRVRHGLRDQMQRLWQATGTNWILEAARGLETPFPPVPTHREYGGRTVAYSAAQEGRLGSFGAGRLVQPPGGGDPVPFYETVRPPAELIARLLANVEAYLWVCRPLLESGAITSDQMHGMLQYALTAPHEASPEREFSRTAGDVGNDLLHFVDVAQRVLNPQEVDPEPSR
ncbi:hypothetical protein GTW98_03930 [Streptomyces sp. SID8375]|uniref:hypothetical protein n=1 Tax=unclassified Streptomyces TaxID=2593676 RepID=UPI00131A1FCF|nr:MULTISPECIES: hypothetical protein [unclassified Streptomyces]MYX05964.1 hypothetical protein [Streptomyces sp. SID8375]